MSDIVYKKTVDSPSDIIFYHRGLYFPYVKYAGWGAKLGTEVDQSWVAVSIRFSSSLYLGSPQPVFIIIFLI